MGDLVSTVPALLIYAAQAHINVYGLSYDCYGMALQSCVYIFSQRPLGQNMYCP